MTVNRFFQRFSLLEATSTVIGGQIGTRQEQTPFKGRTKFIFVTENHILLQEHAHTSMLALHRSDESQFKNFALIDRAYMVVDRNNLGNTGISDKIRCRFSSNSVFCIRG